MHFIWLSFIATFGKRAGANPAYWSFIAMLLAVMALRLIAWRRSSVGTRAVRA